MKTLFTLILALLSQTIMAEVSLYIKDSTTPYEINEMEDILEKFQREAPEKNILFYVHGRAAHLEKNIERINQLEAAYNVKVVMLKWDAWSGALSRPTENANTASTYLLESLIEINKFKKSHPYFSKNNKITLFCHSMGNLVLKDMVDNYLQAKPELKNVVLFDNFVSVGADVPLNGHHNWLSRFTLAKAKYVTSNNRDGTLRKSYLLDLKKLDPLSYKLGLGLESVQATAKNAKSKLDPETLYINFSKLLKDEHAYYLSPDMAITDLFDHLFNGNNFLDNFSLKTNLKVMRIKNVITLTR